MHSNDDTSVQVEPAVLSDAHLPDKLPGRESQAAEMLRCLAAALKTRQPIHLWLHGRPGAGKTASILHVLRHYREKRELDVILVNCWQSRTLFEILDEMIVQLRVLRAEQHRTSVKLEKLRSRLAHNPSVIVLDEIDRLAPAERSSVVYCLQSLGSASLVCISNSLESLFELDERARSRLAPYVVSFPGYAQEGILEILRRRAALSLKPGTWNDKTLRTIAGSVEGDARAAITALRTAAKLAEQERRAEIRLTDLKAQWSKMREAQRAQVLETLTEDHRILHEIVTRRSAVVSGDLWRSYVESCRQRKRKPLAQRTFSNYANQLVQMGLIASEQAREKGKVRLFRRIM